VTDTDIAVGDHRDLLDIIDSLRSQGVSHYVDLPEIIVCGDQSAGKSSVLEAISGMPFPTKDGLCTRFATELVLRRGREVNTKVSITPGESRFGKDKERLESWQPEASIDKEGLGTVTDEAKRAMAETTGTGEFYEVSYFSRPLSDPCCSTFVSGNMPPLTDAVPRRTAGGLTLGIGRRRGVTFGTTTKHGPRAPGTPP